MHLRSQVYDKPEDPPAAPVPATPVPGVSPTPAAAAPVVAATPAPTVTPAAGAEPAPAPVVAPAKDWKDDRIAKLTYDLNEERRKQKAALPPAPEQKPGETEADFARRVDEAATAKAGQMAAQADWDRRCNEVGDAGNKEFADFLPKLQSLQATINPQDSGEVVAYNQFVEAAIETGQAHRILYAMSNDPGEYQRLNKLSPVKRAMELGVMASKLVASPEPSNAPKPITPVGGGNGQHYDGVAPDDPKRGMKMPTKQWMAEREKQARERGIQ